jgi:AcrR family transcriptional regulator
MAGRSRDASEKAILKAARRSAGSGRLPGVGELAAAAGVSRATFYRRVGSRRRLQVLLDLDPDPSTRERILAAALEQIGQRGLSAVSMEEVAAAAGISRAALYRIFPGKAALFAELVRAFSPLNQLRDLFQRRRDDPPEQVVPEMVGIAYAVIASRPGLLRTVFLEVTSLAPEAEAAGRVILSLGLAEFVRYLGRQMELGRLRPTHPLLAVQFLLGPLFFHIITRPLLDRLMGLDVSEENAVRELAANWLRAMRPEPNPGGDQT